MAVAAFFLVVSILALAGNGVAFVTISIQMGKNLDRCYFSKGA